MSPWEGFGPGPEHELAVYGGIGAGKRETMTDMSEKVAKEIDPTNGSLERHVGDALEV